MGGVILGKLSVRELALAARACREFQRELIARVTKERAARVLAAEATLGKDLFDGLVTAVQRIMCGLTPYPGGPHLKDFVDGLVISDAGEARVVTRPRSEWWRAMGTYTPYENYRVYAYRFNSAFPLDALVRSEHGRTTDRVCLSFEVMPYGTVHVAVTFHSVAAVTATGLMLAICTGNPEATPAQWQNPLVRVTLIQLTDLCDNAGTGAARDEFEPRTSRAESVLYCAFNGVHPTIIPGAFTSYIYPLLLWWERLVEAAL